MLAVIKLETIVTSPLSNSDFLGFPETEHRAGRVSDDAERAHHVRRYRRGELEHKMEKARMRVAFSGSYYCFFRSWPRPGSYGEDESE